jgi:hypothetical protein
LGFSSSGLQIQNYQNVTHPNHTVIAIAGTNGLNDWDDNVSFVTGGLSEQFQQALRYSLFATMALAPGASKVTPFKPKV